MKLEAVCAVLEREEHEEMDMMKVKGRCEQDAAQNSPAKQRDRDMGKQPDKVSGRERKIGNKQARCTSPSSESALASQSPSHTGDTVLKKSKYFT